MPSELDRPDRRPSARRSRHSQRVGVTHTLPARRVGDRSWLGALVSAGLLSCWELDCWSVAGWSLAPRRPRTVRAHSGLTWVSDGSCESPSGARLQRVIEDLP